MALPLDETLLINILRETCLSVTDTLYNTNSISITNNTNNSSSLFGTVYNKEILFNDIENNNKNSINEVFPFLSNKLANSPPIRFDGGIGSRSRSSAGTNKSTGKDNNNNVESQSDMESIETVQNKRELEMERGKEVKRNIIRMHSNYVKHDDFDSDQYISSSNSERDLINSSDDDNILNKPNNYNDHYDDSDNGSVVDSIESSELADSDYDYFNSTQNSLSPHAAMLGLTPNAFNGMDDDDDEDADYDDDDDDEFTDESDDDDDVSINEAIDDQITYDSENSVSHSISHSLPSLDRSVIDDDSLNDNDIIPQPLINKEKKNSISNISFIKSRPETTDGNIKNNNNKKHAHSDMSSLSSTISTKTTRRLSKQSYKSVKSFSSLYNVHENEKIKRHERHKKVDLEHEEELRKKEMFKPYKIDVSNVIKHSSKLTELINKKEISLSYYKYVGDKQNVNDKLIELSIYLPDLGMIEAETYLVNSSVHVVELIGYVLFKLKEGNKKFDINKDILNNPNYWKMYIADDDGEIEDDFGMLDRLRSIESYGTDEFVIIKCTDEEFAINEKKTPSPLDNNKNEISGLNLATSFEGSVEMEQSSPTENDNINDMGISVATLPSDLTPDVAQLLANDNNIRNNNKLKAIPRTKQYNDISNSQRFIIDDSDSDDDDEDSDFETGINEEDNKINSNNHVNKFISRKLSSNKISTGIGNISNKMSVKIKGDGQLQKKYHMYKYNKYLNNNVNNNNGDNNNTNGDNKESKLGKFKMKNNTLQSILHNTAEHYQLTQQELFRAYNTPYDSNKHLIEDLNNSNNEIVGIINDNNHDNRRRSEEHSERNEIKDRNDGDSLFGLGLGLGGNNGNNDNNNNNNNSNSNNNIHHHNSFVGGGNSIIGNNSKSMVMNLSMSMNMGSMMNKNRNKSTISNDDNNNSNHNLLKNNNNMLKNNLNEFDDETNNALMYHRWTVWRRQHMKFKNKLPKTLTVDGYTIYLLPFNEFKGTWYDSKTYNFEISQILKIKQNPKIPNHFKIIIKKNDEGIVKKYYLEAQNAKECRDIVATIRSLAKTYSEQM